jgi:hypothetical protein
MVALVACAAALGAGGWAFAASKRSNTIKACANRHSGVLRLASHCRRNERKVVWSKVGPPGVQGATGPQGPAGAAGAAGPGATHAAWQVGPSGNESAPYQTAITVGEWTFFARCITNSGGDLQLDVQQAGPGAFADVTHSNWNSQNPLTSLTQVFSARSSAVPASSPSVFDLVTASDTFRAGAAWDETLTFDDGSMVHSRITDTASNKTGGGITPYCRVAAVTFPVS